MSTKTAPAWVELRRRDKAARIATALRDAGFTARTAVTLDAGARRRIEDAASLLPSQRGSGAWLIAVEMLAGSGRDRALCVTCSIGGNPLGEPGPPLRAGHDGECVR